jgi:CDP-diacylglycerol--glycerol-3-phosphate 3-phosphatidyltransferase
MRRRLSPQLKREFFNVPNILTYLRIAAIPFVLFFLGLSQKAIATNEVESRWLCFVSFALFVAAALTDYLDGYIARTRNQTTLVGKFVDPIADKLIVLATLVMLVELRRVEAWIVILILLREVSISGLRTLAIADGLHINVVAAGKLKTAFQLCGLCGLILYYPYTIPVLNETVRFGTVGEVLILISLFFSFMSAFSYFRGFVEAILKKYAEKEDGK